MQLGIIEVPTLKELFVEKIEEQIISGKLKVGDPLPSERQLQLETHISKTVIHAGLVELEQKGFIEIIPRKGTFVANYAENGTVESLNTIIKLNGGAMTEHQAESFLQSRIAIEGSALKLLAANAGDEDIAYLQNMLSQAEEIALSSPLDIDALADALYLFYRGICVRSGNEFFPLLLNEFRPIIHSFWVGSIQMYGVESNMHMTRRFLDEIKQHDIDAAYSRLVKNVNQYLAAIKGSNK